MYDQILVPYDGTEEAERSARHGVELAAALDAGVHGLYVIDLPGAPRALALRDDEEQMREEYREYGEQTLEELKAMADEHGVEFTSAMRTGSVAEEIVDYADEAEVDAIVIGTAYRGAIGNLIGGTTDKVVRTATVPVITKRMQFDDV